MTPPRRSCGQLRKAAGGARLPMLEAAPGIRAVAIFEEICGRHPEGCAGSLEPLDSVNCSKRP